MSYVVFLGMAIDLNSGNKKMDRAIYEAFLERYLKDGMEEPVAIKKARIETIPTKTVNWSSVFFRDMVIAFDPKKTSPNEAICLTLIERYLKEGMERQAAIKKAHSESDHLRWQIAGI